MNWKDVGKAVGKFAPLLGTAFGGPAVGGVVSMVASALGLSGEEAESPDAVMAAIRMDPNAALKLRTVQEENKVELAKITLQLDIAYLADRQGARSREVEITKATGMRDVNLYILAYLFVLGFFASTIAVSVLALSGKMPEGIPQAVVFLLGNLFATLSAGTLMVLGYFYGTSKSSSDKTKMMMDLSQKNIPGRD